MSGKLPGRILEAIQPETAYFTEQDGRRGGIFVIDIKMLSDLSSFSEPFFLNFQADCKFRMLMSPEDLQKAGLEALGKKWA
ncbi:panthothenate synthetase [Polaromonas sp. UC242_47]|uniref:panthothenate synthetase n=1 Tax=Polaromonas sp. UC242_47 TaxID=3374626 RepID=UPI0037AC82AF